MANFKIKEPRRPKPPFLKQSLWLEVMQNFHTRTAEIRMISLMIILSNRWEYEVFQTCKTRLRESNHWLSCFPFILSIEPVIKVQLYEAPRLIKVTWEAAHSSPATVTVWYFIFIHHKKSNENLKEMWAEAKACVTPASDTTSSRRC